MLKCDGCHGVELFSHVMGVIQSLHMIKYGDRHGGGNSAHVMGVTQCLHRVAQECCHMMRLPIHELAFTILGSHYPLADHVELQAMTWLVYTNLLRQLQNLCNTSAFVTTGLLKC